MRGTRLAGALLSLASLLQVALALRIAAFNIRTFGEAKMSNATLSDYIVQIVNRYDIALIQEVRDSHLTAVGSLLDKLNQWVTAVGSQGYWCRQEPTCEWPKIPTGICFKPGMTPTPSITWSASRWDAAPTRSATSSCSDLTRCPCQTVTSMTMAVSPAGMTPSAESQRSLGCAPHSRRSGTLPLFPCTRLRQMQWLRLTHSMTSIWTSSRGGAWSYVSPSSWPSIRLRTSPAFQWLIPDTADTTVTSTHCAYDRIVVAGTLLQRAVVPGSAAPFDFQAAFGLSNQTAQAVSDHYPVEVRLRRA
ncbi:deoxyribonuclease-1 isoform X1 [Manis pentadactyla]|uniref:deoxyribonuclease-1 isoform X1 n=1 Tax=Manis pentadactyla TaxID=143292 RepID=UPI00255CD9D7|nr:deoxyribonuclease-1 isoform X1 [Manis pentadactyla]